MATEQVIIIGAGPAGIATAIQLKRYGIQPVIFERYETGGLLLNANLVENYPGFPEGIRGVELVKQFVHQARRLDLVVTPEEVLDLDYDQGLFRVHTSQKSYSSRLVVVATGTKARHLADINIPESLAGKVYYEVYPLLEAEGKSIAIIGSGDAAFDYGLNLSRKNQVTILNRGALPKCLPLLWDRAQNAPGLTYHAQTNITQLLGTQDRIRIDCQAPVGGLKLDADYLIGAIGREPELDCLPAQFLQKVPELEKQGVFFMIGDVKNGIFRQTAIAVGEGVLTAMKICRQLEEN